MNFFAARRTSRGVTVNNREIPVVVDLHTHEGVEAIVGVRPEAVIPGEAGPDALPISGRVVAVETLGAETLCHVETDLIGVAVDAGRVEAGADEANTFLIRLSGNRAELAGQTIQLRADLGGLRVFDPRTGRAASIESSGNEGVRPGHDRATKTSIKERERKERS